jgi:hypothetical protein
MMHELTVDAGVGQQRKELYEENVKAGFLVPTVQHAQPLI